MSHVLAFDFVMLLRLDTPVRKKSTQAEPIISAGLSDSSNEAGLSYSGNEAGLSYSIDSDRQQETFEVNYGICGSTRSIVSLLCITKSGHMPYRILRGMLAPSVCNIGLLLCFSRTVDTQVPHRSA